VSAPGCAAQSQRSALRRSRDYERKYSYFGEGSLNGRFDKREQNSPISIDREATGASFEPVAEKPSSQPASPRMQLHALEEIMRGFAIPILVAAAAIYSSAHDVVWAQAATATTQQVSPVTPGLSTPVTSTVTNCMLSCSSQAANCRTGCFIQVPPGVSAAAGPFSAAFPTPILNATVSPACTSSCTSTQLVCQTNCARLSSIQGQ
jgi:hypothetical protein